MNLDGYADITLMEINTPDGIKTTETYQNTNFPSAQDLSTIDLSDIEPGWKTVVYYDKLGWKTIIYYDKDADGEINYSLQMALSPNGDINILKHSQNAGKKLDYKLLK